MASGSREPGAKGDWRPGTGNQIPKGGWQPGTDRRGGTHNNGCSFAAVVVCIIVKKEN